MGIRAISYGGGVQSTALLVLAARGEIDFPFALFANTGDDSEHPATLDYVRDVALPYASAHGIELVELRHSPRTGGKTLYQRLTDPSSRSVGIPVRMNGTGAPGRRACTVDFKVRRIASALKKRGATSDDPARVAMGISIDEYQRMRNASGIPWESLTYPLIDLRLDRAACVGIIERAGIPVPPKSSCWFCPFHSLTYWQRQRRDEPDLFAKSVALEALLNDRRTALGKDPVWLTRKLIPLDQAIGDDEQLDMFGGTCDIGGYCHA